MSLEKIFADRTGLAATLDQWPAQVIADFIAKLLNDAEEESRARDIVDLKTGKLTLGAIDHPLHCYSFLGSVPMSPEYLKMDISLYMRAMIFTGWLTIQTERPIAAAHRPEVENMLINFMVENIDIIERFSAETGLLFNNWAVKMLARKLVSAAKKPKMAYSSYVKIAAVTKIMVRLSAT
jgi:hypothetical protein